MAKPEFKSVETRVEQPPDPASLFGEAPPDIVLPQREPWFDIPDPPPAGRYGAAFPYNHAPVLLCRAVEDRDGVVAQWQITRRLLGGRWQPHGFWAARNGGGRQIDFEPRGWRELRE